MGNRVDRLEHTRARKRYYTRGTKQRNMLKNTLVRETGHNGKDKRDKKHMHASMSHRNFPENRPVRLPGTYAV